MTYDISKFSQIQKDAILGKLESMQDAEIFDKEYKNLHKGNELIKSAVNHVALAKFAELIVENAVKAKIEQSKFASAKNAVDADIIKDIRGRMGTGLENQSDITKVAGPALDKIKSAIAGLVKKPRAVANEFLAGGVDDAVLQKLDDMLGIEGSDAATVLGLPGNKEGAQALYNKIKATLGESVKRQAKGHPGSVVNPLDDAVIKNLMDSIPDITRPVLNKQKEPVINHTISDPAKILDILTKALPNKTIQDTVNKTRNTNKILAALGLGTAGGLGYLGLYIPEYIRSTDTEASKYPSRGDLSQYLLGATTGAGTGLGLNYLAQGLGTGNWNPADMDLTKALLAAGVGGTTGAITSPLFPSISELKK